MDRKRKTRADRAYEKAQEKGDLREALRLARQGLAKMRTMRRVDMRRGYGTSVVIDDDAILKRQGRVDVCTTVLAALVAAGALMQAKEIHASK
jgi:hypothetical protein